MSLPKVVIVVGGGLAGLSATLRLCERGFAVKLVSLTKVKRSHSVCAQGGINAAVNAKHEDDSPINHAYDTIKGGDFLANQPPIVEMCLSAPSIIQMMNRFGCPFNRTPEGELDFRRFGGTLYHRTAFCGASTGQQLLYALDEQVRRFEAKGVVEKFEHHEFMRLILDEEGRARGIVMMDLFNLGLQPLLADAVVMATGGLGHLFKLSTNSTFCTGAANGRLFRQGMRYANGEFIQIHPTAIPGRDKMRLISESVRGEGGRIWVYGDSSKSIKGQTGREIPCGQTGKPWYFLEELYPALGNLVPRDIGAREVMRICDMGLGVEGKNQVYLDVTHLPHETLHKLESVLDIYRKFTGEDPRKVPMRIFPAVHYTMGGAWVDYPASDAPDRATRFRHMTSIPGCFSCGEANYQYHGANRLGANALLACIFSGLVTGDDLDRYVQTHEIKGVTPVIAAVEAEERLKKQLFESDGGENIFCLHDELSQVLVRHATVWRSNEGLEEAKEKIVQIKERYSNLTLADRGTFVNQTYIFANQFGAMLELALVIVQGALERDESRGSHFKDEFPKRDDVNFLKTTIATYSQDGPKISYEPVDIRHLKPMQRDYVHAKREEHQLENLPDKFHLPL